MGETLPERTEELDEVGTLEDSDIISELGLRRVVRFGNIMELRVMGGPRQSKGLESKLQGERCKNESKAEVNNTDGAKPDDITGRDFTKRVVTSISNRIGRSVE